MDGLMRAVSGAPITSTTNTYFIHISTTGIWCELLDLSDGYDVIW